VPTDIEIAQSADLNPASGTAGPSNDISVGEGLIELVFRNGFGVGGIESGGLIEPRRRDVNH
jgi:hypothetical protein